MRLAASAGCMLALAACEGRLATERVVERDLLAGLPRHDEQLQALCSRGRVDAVTTAFCGDVAPTITSIEDVQRRLDVALDGEARPGVTLLANSSALPARSVSAVNPGSVIVSLPESDKPLNGNPGKRRSDGNILSLAFARGDEVVEIAVTPPGGDIAFYLLRYEQACGSECGFEDLLTERTERNWTAWSLYDDEDLKNTVFDCLHCHEPNGPGTGRIYRMQELENPWTHWLASFTLSGRVLLDDTIAAHGTEGSIAGIPASLVFQSNPIVAEDLVRFADSPQPNVFDAPRIEAEVRASNPAQPRDNSVPGSSAAWQLVYDAAVRGDAIPPPYHDVKVTDPDKLAEATAALVAFRAGDMPTLPDIREVFHEEALAAMSHRPKAGLDGRGILVHACAQCHNPRLDQTISRAQFDATDIDALTFAQRERAIERLLLPVDDREHMPPRLFRDLSPAEIEAAIDALRGG